MSAMLLKLLEFKSSKTTRTNFAKPLDEIMYFLLSRIDPVGIKETHVCWPIYDAKQSQEFKAICLKLLDKLYAQGKIKTLFKKFNYDLSKCENNIIELCMCLIKARIKHDSNMTVDELKQSVQHTIETRSRLENLVSDQTHLLNDEIQKLQENLKLVKHNVLLESEKRNALQIEKEQFSTKLKEELEVLDSSVARMNKANDNLVHLLDDKKSLGRMDLVFSEGKTATDFQKYMANESMEPFKDGKLDLVVFLKLYKLLLQEMIDCIKSAEKEITLGVERLPDALSELKNLSEFIQASNLDLSNCISREDASMENFKRLMDDCETEKSVARSFLMNSRISISNDHIDPLEIKDSHQLNSSLVESLNSSIESLMKEKRGSILPAKKSDILKKLARSILSSRKKNDEAETDNIFDENCPSFIMNDDDTLIF